MCRSNYNAELLYISVAYSFPLVSRDFSAGLLDSFILKEFYKKFQVLLRRFQITHNLSLDGVLDFLNSKTMTEAGPMDLIDDNDSDVEEGVDKQSQKKLAYDLPGAMPNHGRPIIRTKCLKIAPTGRSWAAATTEGVLLYSMDEDFIFDPTDLDIDVTPEVSMINIQQTKSFSICPFCSHVHFA